MKKLITLLFLLIACHSYSQLNVTLRSHLAFPVGTELSNIGGYVDSLGNEYALVGWSGGLQIVDVTDPDNPVFKQNIVGNNSSWREVKTWSHYAYVTTEACCDGLQIINLGNLPGTVTSKFWKGSGTIANQLDRIHALHIDNNGILFLYGSQIFNGTAIFVSLADPWNPSYLGHIVNGSYVHDGYAYGDTLWSCHIYDGLFEVWDVSNKANPTLLAFQPTPGAFTHNSWLNDAHTVLFTTDEVSDSYLAAYDITDLSNITELSRIQLTPGSGSIVHNTHTLNDYEIVSWYKDGIAIIDASRPSNMIITGSYDTYTQGSGSGFNGCWGVYPYLPSGNLVVSDIDNGLYVLTPTYVRGCYLEGNVTDSVTTASLNGVTVTILNQNISKQTDLNGDYKTGIATAGAYTVTFAKAGYYTKTLTNVPLSNGIVNLLNVALTPIATVSQSGQVQDNSGNPLPNAMVGFFGAQVTNTVMTDANGQFTIPSFIPDSYNVVAGLWGYETECSSQNVSGSPLIITLNNGYYDDFTLDFGNWSISGTSTNVWERAIPIETLDGINIANPGTDASNDCGDYAMVTDNGGGGPWDNDVDFGVAKITSPVFDLTGYNDPQLNYSRWYYNGGTLNGNPNDTMKVYLSNGLTTVLVETANPSTPDNGTWADRTFQISSLLIPTANMTFSIQVRDSFPVNNIVEAGLDRFSITDIVGVPENNSMSLTLSALPNPFTSALKINYSVTSKGTSEMVITDMIGREMRREILKKNSGELFIENKWPAGMYLIKLSSPTGIKSIIVNKSEK